MILDESLEFADALALGTGAPASVLLGDVVDLGAGRDAQNIGDIDIGESDNMHLVISVDTAATSGGLATVAFHLVSDAQAAIAVDGSATYHFSTAAIPVATLAAGYRVATVALPRGTYERYLGVLQTTGAFALTAGKVNAFLTSNPGKWRAYDQAVNA